MHSYETDLPGAVLALVVWTLVGAIIVTLFAILTDIEYFREYGRQTAAGLLIFIYAAVFWGRVCFLSRRCLG